MSGGFPCTFLPPWHTCHEAASSLRSVPGTATQSVTGVANTAYCKTTAINRLAGHHTRVGMMTFIQRAELNRKAKRLLPRARFRGVGMTGIEPATN
jgi:hypothetical protein